MTMFAVTDLHGYYGTIHVLHGLDFSLEEGRGLAILGRNGAGKSTTFRAILGLLKETTGTVELDGEDVSSLSSYQRARRGLGLVFEDRRVFPDLTVAENIDIGATAKGDREPFTVGEIFEFFPLLADRRSQRAGLLSGGEMQALAIARAVRSRPKVLMLDEPSEGLAPLIVDKLIEDIKGLRETLGLTTIVAEHKQWFARECTEEVAVLDAGHVVFLGDWEELDSQPEILERHLSVG